MNFRSICLAACLPLPLLVAGCNRKADEGKAAAGAEVLPGSISDAMIDLDTSTASPPLAPVKAQGSRKAEGASASEAAEEPAATPATPAASASASAPASGSAE
ncbi:hypothetical protein Saro_0093 [Novosphingobium aromaticivorans DSM 12444]|uniref:Lipoprotein n=1 Tax=Novosphingobium aromaticivorans (strain ATCC 700278 / DSM 12444 / CCUG 56034 / CIP 105152 / NBRC 16084 / F199) TaxID=279238 RepID=Q2GC81_NOVAD|nr:hypothetical protein [Novosphingobium aromaticivorans]ABD24542.1 hypothetical protein Saro_0093 [Novosphingobium aromaticivorans DSM 12444]SCY25088.1 hypothetical protein SAMN05660666_01177 [Novosphingobium aromaticivorans]